MRSVALCLMAAEWKALEDKSEWVRRPRRSTSSGRNRMRGWSRNGKGRERRERMERQFWMEGFL